jgi:hypothetical protein
MHRLEEFLGILYIPQHFVSSNSFNSAFNGTALPALKSTELFASSGN